MTSPGELFATLWSIVVPHAGAVVARPWQGRLSTEFVAILKLLSEASDEHVPSEIEGYLDGDTVPFLVSVPAGPERAFVVMCALDAVTIEIHPAFPRRLPRLAGSTGGMLARMKSVRTTEGHYADVPGTGIVVPKGHLVSRKAPRPDDEWDASGTDLAHQFSHLTLVPHPANGRKVTFVVPPPYRFELRSDLVDAVGLAPIAEDHDDIRFAAHRRGERPYLDALPEMPLLSDRITDAVVKLLDEGAGVVVLPELVGGAEASDALQAVLKRRGIGGALVIAGTGPSADHDVAAGRPHNEAVLLHSDGRLIARQRKLHLFNMAGQRMRDCKIDAAIGCDDRSHMEDAAAGSDLIVCDLHGLGRVMTLICEDLQQQEPCGNVALALRPDWILTPVLDIEQKVGRWTHARAIEIARKTLSRVVVSCCATLAVRMAGGNRLADVGDPIQTGLCFDGAEGNRALFVASTGKRVPERSVVRWDSASWETYRTVASP